MAANRLPHSEDGACQVRFTSIIVHKCSPLMRRPQVQGDTDPPSIQLSRDVLPVQLAASRSDLLRPISVCSLPLL